MSSVCISSCVNDTRVPTRVVRATYVNLYKWPESDAEFVRSLSFRSSSSSTTSGHHSHHRLPHPKVVDSISCRQLYLRSYTFTRKESVNEKTKKCIGRVKEKVTNINGSAGCKNKKKNGKDKVKERGGGGSGGIRNIVKEVPCAALKNIFRSLLFCSASVDVVEGE